jgi:uncharacterized protein
MLIAEARVVTERSGRYLVQLCQHLNKAAQRNPQMQAHVEWSDDRGQISFGWGRCTLRADPGALTLRAEAADEEHLHQLEQRVADRLEQVAQARSADGDLDPAPARRGAAAEPAHRRHPGQREDART